MVFFEKNFEKERNTLTNLEMSASPKIGQKEVVKITNFNNFKDKLRDEKEIHRITNCISH